MVKEPLWRQLGVMLQPTPIFIIVCVEIILDPHYPNKGGSSCTIEPVGVFDDLEEALDYAEKLENIHQSPEGTNTSYDVLDFNLNEKPKILSFLEKQTRSLEDEITSVLMSLMKKGYVEQLIGDDGRFYYELTDKGHGMAEEMPKLVKELFRRKRNPNDNKGEDGL